MTLYDLLVAGAESSAMSYLRSIPWKTDKWGREVRRPLNENDYLRITQAVQRNAGTLTGGDRNRLRQIIDAADNASRRARQLDREGRRLPKPSEIGRLPGTRRGGDDLYTYTTVIELIDRSTGERSTITDVIESREILSGERIRAEVQQKAASNTLTPREGTDPQKLGRRMIERISILSVYRGYLN